MTAERDALGIWVPQRISELSLADLLARVEALRASRLATSEAIDKAQAAAKPANGKPRKSKAVDLSKLSPEDAAQVMADSLGVPLDKLLAELRRAKP